jgi:hypothetical protein
VRRNDVKNLTGALPLSCLRMPASPYSPAAAPQQRVSRHQPRSSFEQAQLVKRTFNKDASHAVTRSG